MNVTSTSRRQKKEAYSHEFIKSEEFYVNELEAVITHVVQPLTKSAQRCNVNVDEIKAVFGIMNHLFNFHLQIIRQLREEINVVPIIHHYFNFIQMYSDYLNNYSSILDTLGSWTSIQFREFVTLRLQNSHVKDIIDGRLCSLPWYLYRPFERMKQYYRFFKDLMEVTTDQDEEFQQLLSCKIRLKPLYNKIKKRDVAFIKKTRLLEIQLQIFGNPKPIVNNSRYFVYNRICQIKTRGLSNRLKHIQLYVFNDMILWVSKRGHWKKTLRFNEAIVYGKATKKNNANDPLLFIGSPNEKNPTHILLANEQARDECLERIKKAHTRFSNKSQRELEKKLAAETSKSKSHLAPSNNKENSVGSFSATIDDSFYMEETSQTNTFMAETMTMRALHSHHTYVNESSSDEEETENTISNNNSNSNNYSKSKTLNSASNNNNNNSNSNHNGK